MHGSFRLTVYLATGIVRLPAVTEQLLAQGAEPIGGSPAALDAFLRADIERWKKLIQQSNISVH